ncbi:acetolactate synthase, partial [Leucobacter sp. OLES1]
ASLAFPDRRAVAVCGDGDFLMNGQEIATAIAHGGSPLVVVVDNGIYGTIVQHQEHHYPGRPSGTRMANPDFAAWMRSFGGHGELVERTEEFADALDRALAAGGPALIHVRIDSRVMPPASAEIAA